MAQIELTLYSGPHCELCDQALDLLAPRIPPGFRLLRVDISTSRDLKKRYGLRIPVLQRQDSGAELDWPFSSADVDSFLG